MSATAFPSPALSQVRPILITGGAGFIGCNLADRLAGLGHHVLVYDALSRPGVSDNLDWLTRRHGELISVHVADVRDHHALANAGRDASAVVHLAAQVAVTTSLEDPLPDFEINTSATLILLEALRKRGGRIPFLFASTNKVYGDLADVALDLEGKTYRPRDERLAESGIAEQRPLDFHTPYGCSKGAADQYVLDYAHSFGLPAAVFRMSCIYGPHQRGTEDQGWVAHFLIRALKGEQITIFGDGCQVRDILFVDDAVTAYVAGIERIGLIEGRAFNLGGGPANAVSLLQVLGEIEHLTARKLDLKFEAWRPGDQRWYVSDPRAIVAALGLSPAMPWRAGLAALAEWLKSEREEAHTAPPSYLGAAE